MKQELPLGYPEQVIFRLRSLYNRHGYSQYRMSKFEEYDLYARNKDFLISDSVITFMDTNGKLMALKPDVTLSIVKNIRDNDAQLHKLYYNENVYRVTKNAHCFKEIMQVGLECIGNIDTYSILEVLSLAAESLQLISPRSILDISHLGVLSELLDRLGIPAGRKKEALACIGSKNIHELDALCRGCGLEEEKINLLNRTVTTSGAPTAVLPEIISLVSGFIDPTPLEQLLTITRSLEGTPAGSMLKFDFSAVDDTRYYNGILFKGFVEGLPNSVLSGGQYDNLMRKMRRSAGAIGFAVYMDALERLDDQKSDFDVDTLVLYSAATPLSLIRTNVDRLTGEGRSVLVQQSIPQGIRPRQILNLTETEVEDL